MHQSIEHNKVSYEWNRTANTATKFANLLFVFFAKCRVQHAQIGAHKKLNTFYEWFDDFYYFKYTNTQATYLYAHNGLMQRTKQLEITLVFHFMEKSLYAPRLQRDGWRGRHDRHPHRLNAIKLQENIMH